MSLREQLADIILHNINSTLKSDGSFDKDIIKPILSLFSTAVEEALAQRDDALIKKIKGMMKEVNDNSNIGEDTEFAYNEALYDLLSHLQETESKDIE